MKSAWLLLTTLLLAVSLAGCGPSGEAPEEEEEAPLALETLTVEIQRRGQDAGQLLEAVRRLPEALRGALADRGVAVEQVRLTVGSSHAATVQALEQGGVDVAFLPAEALAGLDRSAPVMLVSGPLFRDQGEELENWNRPPEEGTSVPGRRALICAAPTAYGENLAGRGSLTWEEVSRARWGVLGRDALEGRRAVDLWLADHFEGSTLSDLPDTAVYADFPALLRAAAEGEIDLFPMAADVRETWAEAWTLPPEETDARGEAGLGRTASIWEETAVVGLTERFYDMAAAMRPGEETLADPRFAQALAEAVNALTGEGEDAALARAAFGTGEDGGGRYAPAPEDALSAAKRLGTLPA